MYASEFGCVDVALLLVEAGAEKNLMDQHGQTALMWAARNGHMAVACLLFKGADQHARTALMLASQSDHVHVADELLEGAKMNLTSHLDGTHSCWHLALAISTLCAWFPKLMQRRI